MRQTRFAPSPTGHLHLGHAYSALQCWIWSQNHDRELILRIEDIDRTRCRQEYVSSIIEDLSWLGLSWKAPIRYQSEHHSDYEHALLKLSERGVLYPCTCSRKDIEIALSAPHIEDHAVYPGTCRGSKVNPSVGESYNLRLDVRKAIKQVGTLHWHEENIGKIEATPETIGDIVIARKDIGTSYHLSVVVDDAYQGVETVIRGMDLFEVTHIHRLLQALLEFPTPRYLHHRLLLDEEGQRLAKRRGGALIRTLRENGHNPSDIFKQINLFPYKHTYS